MVDLPDPFSPTRNVTPGARARPSATSCATAGIVIGHAPGSRRRSGSVSTRTTGGWSKSTSEPYDAPPPRFVGMPSKPPAVEIEVDDRVVRVSNPDRVYFPESGATKLDLVEYYLAVGPGIVNAL